MSASTTRFVAFVASVVALASIVSIEYNVSNELVIGQFLLVPVAIAAWFGGKRPAWLMAGVAWLSWIWVNYHNMPHYSHESVRYWNFGLILVRLVVAGTIFAMLREALDSSRRNLAEKEAALKTLSESTAELRAYEGKFQTICAWTNQIKDGNEWISFPEFLTRHLRAQITHGISPEAAAKLHSDHQQTIAATAKLGEPAGRD
jgi:K+-sensing histidine kinase KdpD